MIELNTIKSISKDAKATIRKNSDGQPISKKQLIQNYYLFYYILPITASLLSFFVPNLSNDFLQYITTGVAIFSGLFFTLLLNISTKIRDKSQDLNVDRTIKSRFKENMKQISIIAQYNILLGIFIIMLILIFVITSRIAIFSDYYITKILLAIIFSLVLRYFATLFSLLQRLKFVVRDEIETS